MALNKSGLEGELTSLYSKENLPTVTAQKTAQAIANYWQGGLSNLGGVPIASATIALMVPNLLSVWSATQASKEVAAKKVADAIDAAFLSMIITGGKHGAGGIASTDKPGLESGMASAYNHPTARLKHAQDFATAIDTYTKAGQVFGTGVPPDFVKPKGPLS